MLCIQFKKVKQKNKCKGDVVIMIHGLLVLPGLYVVAFLQVFFNVFG